MKESITELDTPCLLVDSEIIEQNMERVQQFTNKHQLSLRPHIKTHKSVAIAKRQLQLGAVGITVAKLEEAEAMAKAGIKNILLAYPISRTVKMERLKKISKMADITVAVDSIEQANMLQQSFQANHSSLEVWIKVNSGLNRCGVEPNAEVVQLAEYITKQKKLNLTGIFTHAGHSYAATNAEEITKIAKQEAAAINNSATLCEENGITIKHRSVGSTPTYQQAGQVDGITEVRPGNAVFFDMVQVSLGVAKKENCAVTILASVVSIKSNRLIIDAGSKALSLDKGAHGNDSVAGHGHIVDHPDLVIERLSEEHGIIPLKRTPPNLNIGDTIQIIPNHACTVVNLFDQYIVHQRGTIKDKWNVTARGKMK